MDGGGAAGCLKPRVVKKPQKCFFAVTHGGGMVQYRRHGDR